MEGLSRSAAYVYSDWGIRCNVIQPGFIETDMTQAMASSVVMRKMSEHTTSNTVVLLRRSGKAEEIAYLGNERSHHMLTLLKKKDEIQEKMHEFEAFFHRYF